MKLLEVRSVLQFLAQILKDHEPMRAETKAISIFVTVKISINASVRVLPCPLAAVNSPINKFE